MLDLGLYVRGTGWGMLLVDLGSDLEALTRALDLELDVRGTGWGILDTGLDARCTC